MRFSLWYWRCLQAGASGTEAPQLPGPGSDGLLDTAVGEPGLCFKGNVSSPDRLGSDRGWVRWELRGARSSIFFFLWMLCLCPGALPVFGFCSAFPPLSDSKLSMSEQIVLPPYWGVLLCVGGQPLSVSEPHYFSERSWEMSLGSRSAAGGAARAPALQPALPSGTIELIKVTEEQLSY